MPSLRYHSGKLVLIPKEDGWLLRLKTKDKLVEIPLSGDCVEDALIQAEQIYVDMCVISSNKVRCQQCVHWQFVDGMCGLGFPEGKQTGGKHAKECAVFWRKV